MDEIKYRVSEMLLNMGDFLSLSEAAKISGYHRDYLSFLVRKGELKAERIGRNWFLSEGELRIFLKKKNGQAEIENNNFKNKKVSVLGKILVLALVACVVFVLIFIINQSQHKNSTLPAVAKTYEVKTFYSDTGNDVSATPSGANLVNKNTGL